ncbi:MAG: DNA polymerase III subunit gamma/tau [Halieaceae bacterium]
MSHQVLARKWRPRIFREMVGQEHVLQALINALDHDRLHHAYLFTGTRGVGKTTVARILAKCLNCESGVSSEPCGECSSCLEIAEGRSVDLIEVDAASRTKVEDTRELLENVQYAPTRCRYKVYLIDEVHMLSASSFNALLKTLEEPPPHVVFLLATTDPQKLPATVLSRCLQFNLKNMSAELIVGHLKNVLDQEMVSYEEPALWLLGRAADGSMRDALSLTDQAIAFGSGKLDESDVRSMLGTVDLSFVYKLLQAVIAQDAAATLGVVGDMSEHAPDYAGTLQELASLLHRVALAQAVPDSVDNSWGDAAQVSELAQAISAEDAQLYYQLAVTGRRDIGLAPEARSGMEMCLLRMIAFRPVAVLDQDLGPEDLQESGPEVAAPVKKPEPAPAQLSQAVAAPTAIEPPLSVPEPDTVPQPITEPISEALTEALTEATPEADPAVAAAVEDVPGAGAAANTSPLVLEPARWAELLDQLPLSGIVYNVASHCELRQVDGDRAYLVLDESNASLYNDSQAQRIGAVLSESLGREIQVNIEVGSPRYETPAARAQRLLDERQAKALDAIESDPRVKLLLDRFGGTIDRESVTPIKH